MILAVIPGRLSAGVVLQGCEDCKDLRGKFKSPLTEITASHIARGFLHGAEICAWLIEPSSEANG